MMTTYRADPRRAPRVGRLRRVNVEPSLEPVAGGWRISRYDK